MIQLIGSQSQIDHFKALFPQLKTRTAEITELTEAELTLDLSPDSHLHIEHYQKAGGVVLCNSVNFLLESVRTEKTYPQLFGFNGMTGLISAEGLEVCVPATSNANDLAVLQSFGIPYHLVDSRVGLVTPRIVLMIINEAYFTVQEGTAEKDAIDMAMKLGTAYPKGPFEWSELIGLPQVVETLEAIFRDTGDDRYKICPLLKKEAALASPN
jgi:3-hydroxybutyryl-CoA dehydrogenase